MLVGFCQKPQRQSFPPPPTDSISSGFEAEPLFFPELPLRLGSNRFSVLLFFLYYSSQTTLITFFFFRLPVFAGIRVSHDARRFQERPGGRRPLAPPPRPFPCDQLLILSQEEAAPLRGSAAPRGKHEKKKRAAPMPLIGRDTLDSAAEPMGSPRLRVATATKGAMNKNGKTTSFSERRRRWRQS